jgi:DNA-binding transcriptional LysR family regulator
MGTELRHLRYFAAVADDLSFSSAARRLYVSQQALSRTIQQLERQVGVKLFERTTRSVKLTPAGAAMLVSAKQSIAAADHAVDEAQRASRGEPVRPLRIDVSSGGLQTGALVLRRLRRDHPDVAVDQVEEGVARGVVSLEEGRLDAVLGLAPARPGRLAGEAIRHEPVLVGMAASHPFAELDAVPVAGLAGVRLLLPSRAAAQEWIDFVEQFCSLAGVTPSRWPGTTHGSASAADVVREHDCVVPTTAWADPPADLAFRPLVDPRPVFTWSLITLPASHPRVHPALARVRAAVRDLGSELGWLAPPTAPAPYWPSDLRIRSVRWPAAPR